MDLTLPPAPGGGEAPQPVLDVTAKTSVKVAASIALIGVGMHYLASGRERGDLGRMLAGAAFCLLSLLVFAL